MAPPAGGERWLAQAWEDRRFDLEALADDAGHPLQVVFPGRRWGGPGPDFRGALIARPDGSLLRGDVEIHVRASDWVRHGHHRDPAYRSVALHVVAVRDAPTLDCAGRPVPTAVIRPARVVPLPLVSPCVHQAQDVRKVVREAGRARFSAHAARFEGDVAAVGPAQALWRGVAEALGYSRNTRAFGLLADVFPWPEVVAGAASASPAALEAALLAAAGLTSTPAAGADLRPRIAPGTWDLLTVRPANDPSHRLRGLAALGHRWAQMDGADNAHVAALLAHVQREATARHPRIAPFMQAQPWVGPGRARTIVVNIVLPLAAALGLDEAHTLYERLPGEPLSRPIAYMASQLGVTGVTFTSACERQGLLHLFKTACVSRGCGACPARKTAAGASPAGA